MKEVLFDYDSVARKPQIVSEYLSQIREHFSVEDKALLFVKRRTGRNMPVRKYAITNKGNFDAPFFEEICSEIKFKFPSLKLKASQSFLDATKIEPLGDTPIQLNLTPRDYQIDGISNNCTTKRTRSNCSSNICWQDSCYCFNGLNNS